MMEEVSDERLVAPCPFCESDVTKQSFWFGSKNDCDYHIFCLNCSDTETLNGPCRDTLEEAIEAWNRRSTSQKPTGVKVKGLEWHGPDVSGDIYARTILAVYTVRKKQGSLGYWLTEVGGYHSTIDVAKAAAEADYERRILSALEPQQEEPVVWGGAGTAGNMIAQLRTFDPETPIYGAFHAEYKGERRAFVRGLTMSRERVNGRKIEQGNEGVPYSVVVWSAPENDPEDHPTTQQPVAITDEMVERAQKELHFRGYMMVTDQDVHLALTAALVKP